MFRQDADAEYIDQATVILNKLKLNDLLEKVLEYERERKMALLRSRRNNSSDNDDHNTSTSESHNRSFRSIPPNDSQFQQNNQPINAEHCDSENVNPSNSHRPNSTGNVFQRSFRSVNNESLNQLTKDVQEEGHEKGLSPPAKRKSLLDMFQLDEEDKEDDPIWQHFKSTQTSSSTIRNTQTSASTKTNPNKKTSPEGESGVQKKKQTLFRNTQSASSSSDKFNKNSKANSNGDEHITGLLKKNSSFRIDKSVQNSTAERTSVNDTTSVSKTKNAFFTDEDFDDDEIDDFLREDLPKKSNSLETKSKNAAETCRQGATSSSETNSRTVRGFRAPFKMKTKPMTNSMSDENDSIHQSTTKEKNAKSSKYDFQNKDTIVDSPPDLADFDKDSLWDDDVLNSGPSSTQVNKNKNDLNSTSRRVDAYADTLLITTQERFTPDFTAFPPRKRNKPFELKEFEIVNTTTESQLAARVMDVQTPTTRHNELEDRGPKGKLKRFKFRKK